MAGFDNEILYSNGVRLEESSAQDIFLAQKTNSVSELNISGSPEGVVSANPSSLVHDRTGGGIYQKVSGTGNTGWKLITNAGTDLYESPYIVDAAGGPGSSYTTIQAAVTQAIADGATSTVRNILIRPGTYTETFSITTANVKLNFIGIGAARSTTNLTAFINGTLTINNTGIYTGFENLLITTLTYTSQLISYINNCVITTINANSGNTYNITDSNILNFNNTFSGANTTLTNCNVSTISATDGAVTVIEGTVATCNLSSPAQAIFRGTGANFAGSTGGTLSISGAASSPAIMSGSATISQIESQQGNFILQRSISSSGNAATTDYLILVDSSGGAVTVTIPTTLKNKGRSLIIKDVGGAAAANNITITPTSATIDGVASKIISSNYGALTIFYNGTNYFTL